MPTLDFYVIKLLLLSTAAFVLSFALTPLLTKVLYKYKLGKSIRNNGTTPIFSLLHAHKAGTPTMGGVLIWLTTAILILFFAYVPGWLHWPMADQLNFLSRNQTWLPLGALVASALVGLFDDWLDIKGKGTKGGGGMSMRRRLLFYTLIAVVGALWFYFKLGRDVFTVPFVGQFQLGWWYIVAFVFVMVATAFSVNQTDGLDGLAGGLLLIAFSAYAIISFVVGKYDLSMLCGVIVGGLLSFLWFNIAPARFYMGDTGSMSLGITLGIIAMLTDTPMILIFIGCIFVAESLSTIIQLTSKKFRHKKVFLSSPLHHHFEAIGWPETKVVMRFWLIGAIGATIGLALFLLNRL